MVTDAMQLARTRVEPVALDRNRTVWQRVNDRLLALMDRDTADALTAHLHPYVIAEREDAR